MLTILLLTTIPSLWTIYKNCCNNAFQIRCSKRFKGFLLFPEKVVFESNAIFRASAECLLWPVSRVLCSNVDIQITDRQNVEKMTENVDISPPGELLGYIN
jgi:hypothetical protein